MHAISMFVACDHHVNLFVQVISIFCELTSQDYVPKMPIRPIQKALDVGSR